MKNFINFFSIIFVSLLFLIFPLDEGFAQGITRTIIKNDSFDFASGGTVAITGAPKGSIKIEGGTNNKIELEAEITINAPSEADAERIGRLTGFSLDEAPSRATIITVGIHDRKYLSKMDKKFPKSLLGAQWRVDYRLKVPKYCDLQIDGGSGDLSISGVDGEMRLNFIETNAQVELLGGGVIAVIGSGRAHFVIPSRSWRGRFADIQLASGTLEIELPAGLSAEVDASILRNGKIENSFTELKPRIRKMEFTDRSIIGKSGVGGVPLKFTVGDGTLKLSLFQGKNFTSLKMDKKIE
jgi:hypothetical protein